MSDWSPGFLIFGLYGAFLTGVIGIRLKSPAIQEVKMVHRTVFLLLLIVGTPTILQFIFPSILPLFERNRDRVLSGELWRMVTALVFQDGGINGAIFNLVGLFFIGMIGETVWGSRRLFTIFWFGGVCSEIVGLFWQPIGAGNSIANLSIAASIVAWCIVNCRRLPVIVLAILTIGSYLGLFLLKDIHGAAGFIGLALGFGLLWWDKKHNQLPQIV